MTDQSDEQSANARNRTLDQVWRGSARRMSDRQLVLLASLLIPVFLAWVVANLWWPAIIAWWPLALVPIFLSGFGLWGMADRELQESRSGRARSSLLVWSVVSKAAIALAVISAIGATVLFLHFTVGALKL